MAKILVVRHGHSYANKKGLSRFGTEVNDNELGLTPLGEKQIANTSLKLEAYLRNQDIQISNVNIYTSTLMRAIETGTVIKNKLGVSCIEHNPVLNEIHSEYTKPEDKELMISLMRNIGRLIKQSREEGKIPFDDPEIGYILKAKHDELQEYFNTLSSKDETSIVVSHGLSLWTYITEHTTDKNLYEPIKHGQIVLLENNQAQTLTLNK